MKSLSLSLALCLLFLSFSSHAEPTCREKFDACNAECMAKSYDFSTETKMSCSTACGNNQLGCDVAELFPQWAQNSASGLVTGLENFLWSVVTPRNCGPNKNEKCSK